MRLLVWVSGAAVALLIFAGLESWVIYRCWTLAHEPRPVAWLANLIQTPVPALARDPGLLWESTDDIHVIHDQIRRLFNDLDSQAVGRLNRRVTGMTVGGGVPQDQFYRLQKDINRIFESAFNAPDIFYLPPHLDRGWDVAPISYCPSIDDQGTNYVVSLPLPPVNKSDIQVTLQGRTLIIKVGQESNESAMGAQGQGLETQILLPLDCEGEAACAFYANGHVVVQVPKRLPVKPLARPLTVL